VQGDRMLSFAFSPATLHVVETCTTGVKQGWLGMRGKVHLASIFAFSFGCYKYFPSHVEIICGDPR